MKSIILIITSFLIVGCDYLPPSTKEVEEKKMATAKAVGASCKQGGRSIEDCFNLNSKLLKDGILLGWKEMDSYMRENSLKEQPSQISEPEIKAINKKEESKE